MQVETIVDSPELFIGRDAQNQWLYVDWRGAYDPKSTRTACGLLLKSLRAWPCHKIFSDNTGVAHIWLPRTQWSRRQRAMSSCQ
ncbi:hypothetical protein [Hymenobacter terricola]|uniref:hypothetical protein n=1 Tax=Hymenobacter terricola TaxID=2819236 RepID=UPI001B3006DD|nr:hypothetical protein [Hymenobacter terricola]